MKLIFCLLPFLLFSCVGPVEGLYPPLTADNSYTIHIVNHGWHTGIIVKRSQVKPYLSALKNEFLKDHYLEIGWGDAKFYQSGGDNYSYGLAALLWPTDSVLHIVGFSETPVEKFLFSELVELKVSEKGFQNLLNFINNSFSLSENNIPERLSLGLYGRSWFFKSKLFYHLLNTCNHWTAEAIRKTGFPISTFYAITAGNVISQLKKNR